MNKKNILLVFGGIAVNDCAETVFKSSKLANSENWHEVRFFPSELYRDLGRHWINSIPLLGRFFDKDGDITDFYFNKQKRILIRKAIREFIWRAKNDYNYNCNIDILTHSMGCWEALGSGREKLRNLYLCGHPYQFKLVQKELLSNFDWLDPENVFDMYSGSDPICLNPVPNKILVRLAQTANYKDINTYKNHKLLNYLESIDCLLNNNYSDAY